MSHQETLGSGKYLKLIKQDNYEFVLRVNSSGVVIIFPITDQNQVVLVEQYRPAVHAKCIELPAGLINDEQSDETTLEGAKRELFEETGYKSNRFQFLGSRFYSINRFFKKQIKRRLPYRLENIGRCLHV